MSMNTRDERLYHYEYRRPRVYNPTYNSSHVFDSLNMFVRPENPSLLRSSGIRSLPRDGTYLSNHSEIANSRYFHPAGNLSAVLPPSESPRQSVLLNDKDYLYLQMIEDKNRSAVKTRTIDHSRMDNPEAERKNYKGDSLAQGLRDFEASKK